MRSKRLPFSVWLFVLVMTPFLFLYGCGKDDLKKEDFKTEYQAVFLANGSVYFGKIEKIGKNYIEMTDIFYVQSQQNPDTKQVESRLVKRGKELHAPDRMYINSAHILLIEPVSPDSKMVTTMKEIKQQIAK
jgi:hypothetical protein